MTEKETVTGWIAFDAVEIDCSGRRLFVSGSEMPLEPKAFAVLQLLASQPGKAFTRDEILDAVWGHRHVTPGVLNRVVTLIRQALGESAEEHRYLHTLHGVGYRFDAQIRQPGARHAEGAAAALSDHPSFAPARTNGVDEIPHSTVVAANANAIAAAPAAVAAAQASALPHRIDASASRMHARRPLILIVLLMLAIAGAVLYRAQTRPELPAHTAPTLVVLPLRSVGTDRGEAILAEGLSEELTTRLAHIDGLRLISSTSATLAQSGKFDLTQLAEKLKVTHALEGSLREEGDQLRIDLRLIEVPGGKTLWAQDYDRALVNLFAIESDIAQAVATALALQLGIATNADTADIDPTLFRRVLEARTVLRDPPAYPDKNPEAMVRALLAEHADFAPAHGLLALILSLNPLDNPQQRDEVQREAERAIQLDPNLPEAYIALSRCANQVADWERAVAMYQKALQLAPTDSVYRSTYGYVLGGLGYLDEGLHQTEIGVASDPLNLIAATAQVRMLDTIGRHEEAKTQIGTLINLAPENPSAISFARWFNAVWRHDLAGMHAALNAMPAGGIWNDSYAAATAALEDAQRWPEVHAAIEESERRARAQHLRSAFNYLRLIEPQPDYAVIFAGLDATLRYTYPTYYLLIWMPEYRAIRQSAAFQDFLRRNGILDYWRAHGFPPQCKPEGDGARCD